MAYHIHPRLDIEEVIPEIAKQRPYYFVMRDSSMASDSVATNFEQIFCSEIPNNCGRWKKLQCYRAREMRQLESDFDRAVKLLNDRR